MDLAAARERDGGDVRYSVTDTEVLDMATDTPKIRFTDAEGNPFEIHCEILVGADGSQGICKWAIPAEHRTDYFIEYPFAWFGILTEAPPSAPELIYANSEHGFALICQRNETRPADVLPVRPGRGRRRLERGPDLGRAADAGRRPGRIPAKRGPIFDQMVLKFRSYVCEPMRYGNMFLAGDAGHTVPPTGAKGLNLAFDDVKVLFEAIDSLIAIR